MDLYEELNTRLNQLDMSLSNLPKSGANYGKSYTTYRVELAKELIKLKEEGYAISLAGDIARGKPDIARLKFNEIRDEAIYKANLESINATKLAIKIIQEQINKEYGKED